MVKSGFILFEKLFSLERLRFAVLLVALFPLDEFLFEVGFGCPVPLFAESAAIDVEVLRP
jgi:hypothetical protein